LELRFPWIRSHSGLGSEYIPVCTIQIQKRDKRAWFERVFKIDTGSDITFMDKEDCANLGYTLDNCEILHYTDTNNETHRVSQVVGSISILIW